MDSRAVGQMLKERFPEAVLAVEEFRGETTVTIDSGALREVMRFLKEDEATRYDLLVDLAGADFAGASPRFTVAYLLHSMQYNNRLRIKVGAAEGAALDTVSDIWRGRGMARAGGVRHVRDTPSATIPTSGASC